MTSWRRRCAARFERYVFAVTDAYACAASAQNRRVEVELLVA